MTNPFHPEFPFYHPCSTLLLDDDEDFLWSLRSVLGRHHAVLGYSSVDGALSYVRASQKLAADAFNLFSEHGYPAEGREAESGDRFVLLKSSRIHDFAVKGGRYKIVSVAVVDEVMPGMRGLDFCRALKGTGIKTILLTGQMDDAGATIEAFNTGVMDRFISKKDPLALQKLKGMIEELHHEYLAEKLAPFRSALRAAEDSGPARDQLASLMTEVYAEFPFAEYYYHSRSGGYLLKDADGNSCVCLFAEQAELDGLADFIEDQAGPSDASRSLRQGDLVAWDFFDEFGDHRPLEARLGELLFPARKCGGIAWTLVPEDRIPYREKLTHASWADYKERIVSCPINSGDHAA
ncbi:MAG: response regulator [Alphaproteobacteria bacterium]|nr:MAG: response regulator [Alphaproteobacteria bacterium]